MKSLLATLTMAGALWAAPAHAIVVQQTYTGSVVSGADVQGVFGPAGADLAGQAFTAVFTFDLSRGNTSTGPIGGPGSFVQVAGGSDPGDPFLGTPTPLVVSATLSIAGSAAITIAGGMGDRTAVRSSNNPAALPSEYFTSTQGVNGDGLSVFVRSFAATFPASLAATGTFLSSAGASVGDQFRIVDNATFTDRARGVLAPSMLVVTVVPEPAAALLWVIGLVVLRLWWRVPTSGA